MVGLPTSEQTMNLKSGGKTMKGKTRQAIAADRRAALATLVHRHHEEWPASIRHCFYRAVSIGLVEKHHKAYSVIKNDMLLLRRDGNIPYIAVADDTRPVNDIYKFRDLRAYLLHEVAQLHYGYQRCVLQQSQYEPRILVEKASMRAMVARICDPLCIPVDATRGYPSETYVYNLSEMSDHKAMVLILSDFDFDGQGIAESTRRKLIDFGLDEDQVRHIGLTEEQCGKYQLPLWTDKKGRKSVQLDALRSEQMEDLIKTSLADYVDLESIEEETRIYKQELRKLVTIQGKLEAVINEYCR
jgi:hypothetical protein